MSTVSVRQGQAAQRLRDLGRLDVRAMPRVLWRLTRLALRYPNACLLALAAAVAGCAANLAMPRLLGRALDTAHALSATLGGARADAQRELLWIALLLVLACALRGALAGIQGYCGEWIAQRVGHDLRLAFFDQLQRLSFADHDQRHSGDLIARGMLDLEGVRAFLESGVLRVITVLLLLGAGSWRLFSLDAPLAPLALAFVPFVLWRATRMGVLLRLSWQRLQLMMSEMTLGMEENLQGQRVVRAFAAKTRELAKFDVISAAALRLSNQRITLRMSTHTAMTLAYYLSMAGVLFVGGRRVGAGHISVGALSEVLTFMTLLQQPLRQVGMIVNASARAGGAGTRLFEILDAKPAVADAPGSTDLPPGEGVLRFEAVHFAYPSRPEHEVLQDISFGLAAGQMLGVVGPPGSGKSSLAQLIARHYDVTRGRITVDGRDLRQLRLDSLRAQVTLVQQDAFLFDATAHDNIAYAVPLADRSTVEAAARVAQLQQQLERLPRGYDTTVGERGVALSGGQRQRMSIARGLVPRARFVVLDDSSSALDTLTEAHLHEALRPALAGRAVIVISHRLSAVRHADAIIVLDRGRIVERGTHEQLLATHGLYAQLWALQGSEATARPRPQHVANPWVQV